MIVGLIPLSQGKYTIVDLIDYERLAQKKWYYNKGYAVRNIYHEGKSLGLVYMHREILLPGSYQEVDHIDGNGLNNLRKNLRPATRKENSRNRIKLNSNNTSGYRGVYERYGKWIAQISINNEMHHIGTFNDKAEAAAAYNEVAKKHYGEFASLNEIPELVSRDNLSEVSNG